MSASSPDWMYNGEMAAIAVGVNAVAHVDDQDLMLVAPYRWSRSRATSTSYALTHIEGKTVYMHRLILKPDAGLHVDHINHDGLDNRRANLRLCTMSENLGNSRIQTGRLSRFKGVSLVHRDGTWNAYIADGKRESGATRKKNLGYFETEVEAALAYDHAARQKWGAFALTNFEDNGQPYADRSLATLNEDRPKKSRNRGPSNGRAKLTAANIEEILSSPDSSSVLAARFGVCYGTIHRTRKKA